MAPPKTTEGLAVIGLALALHTEGAVCGVDEGDDEFVPVSAARAILSVTGASPPPDFMGYGNEPDFRERERAALHDRPGRIPDWAWGDEANARSGGDAGSDAAGPSQQAAGTVQLSLFDQLISAWREWAALPNLDDTTVGQAEFDRHADRRNALIDAAEALPATIENLPAKGLALAWVTHVDVWLNGLERHEYGSDGRLTLDFDAAICGRLKTRYLRAEA
ncbi:hypothetical protein [Methylorubrum sp. SB2]|uniref:hypothetical protein n=1 Tax=Methylorubrum subtropicum TaxID=3138812 RepID=UPI00313AB287